MVARNKPTKAMKRKTRAAGKAVYAKMQVEASAVVMRNRGDQKRSGNPEYVLFEFPFWVKFSNGFPKGHIVEKTSMSNTYKINAVKLLNWLHANGHSPYDAAMLVKETKQFEYFDKSIERMFDLN